MVRISVLSKGFPVTRRPVSPVSARHTRAVSIRNLAFTVPGGPQLLSSIDLEVSPGDMLGIVGPNGAGKTTLLRCLYGALTPSAGTMSFDDVDASHLSTNQRAKLVAAVPQEANIDVALTVREVVETGRTAHAGRWLGRDPDGAAAVAAAMARVEITDLADRPFPSLSGGERKRTLIARALAQEAPIIVLDEPTNHLDLRHQLELMALLRDLGLTVIVTLHDIEFAARFCDRLAVLARGRIEAAGRPRDVLTPCLMARVFGVAARVSHDPADQRLRIHADLHDPANDAHRPAATVSSLPR